MHINSKYTETDIVILDVLMKMWLERLEEQKHENNELGGVRLMKKMELTDVMEDLERRTGLKFPEGACLCEDKDGDISLIPTNKVDIIEYNIFTDKLSELYIPGGEHSVGSLRPTCTGNYIKKE